MKDLLILVIEDSQTQLDLVSEVLRGVENGRRWVPVPAMSLAAAAEAINSDPERRIEVILSDLCLPDSDPENTLRWLVESDRPFAVLTEYDDESTIRTADAAGARRFVSKRAPLAETHLKIAVYQALAESHRREQEKLAERMTPRRTGKEAGCSVSDKLK